MLSNTKLLFKADSMNILLIDSSARRSASETRKLGERLAARFGENQPATLCRRDVNDGLHLLSEEHLVSFFTPADQRSEAQKKLVELSDTLINELRDCDQLILTIPMYNFNIPTSLKMWQDLVVRENETFVTTETGITGLLENKKAYVIMSTGGTDKASENNLIEKLTGLVLSAMGIDDQTYIYADNLAFNLEDSLIAARKQIDELDI